MPLACEANAPPTEHHPVLTARLIHMPKACPYKLSLLISDFIKNGTIFMANANSVYLCLRTSTA